MRPSILLPFLPLLALATPIPAPQASTALTAITTAQIAELFPNLSAAQRAALVAASLNSSSPNSALVKLMIAQAAAQRDAALAQRVSDRTAASTALQNSANAMKDEADAAANAALQKQMNDMIAQSQKDGTKNLDATIAAVVAAMKDLQAAKASTMAAIVKGP
ncbi:hypothetical protein KVT40_005842 [Elsinoe batatas]|uniref:Uncharacterized protein n=1 Tax=Elsinoe batatas TaxID=2601811 RepID=A0A8K0PFU2_9PEZI|nr:hypothetical protein KVT40_005842 [Elsinoe batatas]